IRAPGSSSPPPARRSSTDATAHGGRASAFLTVLALIAGVSLMDAATVLVGGGGSLLAGRAGRWIRVGLTLALAAIGVLFVVHSARFQLSGKGSIAGVEVDTAQGLVTSDGKASGTVEIVQAGSHVQLQLVVIRRAIYIKGPTGGFQKLPPGAAGAVFDPSRI